MQKEQGVVLLQTQGHPGHFQARRRPTQALLFFHLFDYENPKSGVGGDLCRSISKIFEKSSFLAKKFIYKFRNFRKYFYRGGVTPPPRK